MLVALLADTLLLTRPAGLLQARTDRPVWRLDQPNWPELGERIVVRDAAGLRVAGRLLRLLGSSAGGRDPFARFLVAWLLAAAALVLLQRRSRIWAQLPGALVPAALLAGRASLGLTVLSRARRTAVYWSLAWRCCSRRPF